jgi:UDP-N-acetylglucosamine--N-acetylmuramyl-(pentapeptide) pyrophosphoryl-undecaprenol N-acetylglucosamine transferase
MKNKTQYRFLFAGGGTGGHLFPAVAVAEKIRSIIPDAEIMFIGSKSKIEGTVVPALGFKFKPIWIKGFSRKFTLENILFPLKILVSVIQSIIINMKFKPKVAIGSGGYVSGPAIFGASVLGAKIILLEQNSYPGITTRILEKYSDEIHISFEDSRKYFRKKDKLFLTGNPVRENLFSVSREEALKKFGFNPQKKTLLILGGSLGAVSMNEAAAFSLKKFEEKNIQIIWQSGKNYYEKYKHFNSEFVWVNDFIDDMNFAYSASDLLVARAGATTIAEILAFGIPCVLVPSPNVAANHQYYNAKSLAEKDAAVIIDDKKIKEELFEKINSLITNEQRLNQLKQNALKLGKPDAAEIIAKNAIKIAQ